MKFLLFYFIILFQVLHADIGTCTSPVTISNSSVTSANLNGGEEAYYVFSVPVAAIIKVYTTGYPTGNNLDGELFNTSRCSSPDTTDNANTANVDMTYTSSEAKTIQVHLISRSTGEGTQTSFDLHIEYTQNGTPPLNNNHMSNQYLRTSFAYSKSIDNIFAETEGDPITYSMVGTMPSGITINSTTGLISGTPSSGSEGTYIVNIKATDDDGETLSNAFKFYVQEYTPPTFDSNIPDMNLTKGRDYDYSDINIRGHFTFQNVNFSISTIPSGMTFHEHGYLYNTPNTVATYNANVTLTDLDTGDSVTSNTFTINVVNPEPPTFGGSSDIPDMNLTKGVNYSNIDFSNYFTIPAHTNITYSISTIPSGMSFHEHGYLYSTPDTFATYNASITATNIDSGESVTSNTFTINVVNPEPPTFDSNIPDMNLTKGRDYDYSDINIRGHFTFQNVNFSISTIPSGMTFHEHGYLYNTPNTVATYNANVTLTDISGYSVTSNNFNITILPPPFAQLNEIPNLTLPKGQNFLYNSAQNFEGGIAVTFSTNDPMPPGLSVGSDGAIFGVPTTTGTYSSLHVIATDDANSSLTSNAFTINIVDTAISTGQRDFTMRHQYNVFGDVSVLGNTVLCLLNNAGICIESDPNVSNDSVNLQKAPTSSATLTLPDEAVVMYARIYWQGRKEMGTTWDDASENAAGKISLKKGTGAYIELTADVQDFDTFNSNIPIYSSSANALSIVDGAATYEVDTTSFYTHVGETAIESPSDTLGASGSWVLVVIYSDPNEDDAKNITIFDGYKQVTSGQDATASISGFLTPHTEAIDAKIYVYAAEGDKYLAHTGDVVQMSGEIYHSNFTTLGTFDSRIDLNATRNPNLTNNNGTDLHTYNVGAVDSGLDIIKNNEVGAKFRFTSDDDAYFPSLFVFSADIFIPKLCYDYAIKQDGHYLDIDRASNPEAYIDSRISSSDLEVTVYLKNMESDIPAEGISLTSDVNTTKFDHVGHMYSSYIRTNALVDRGEPGVAPCSYNIHALNTTTDSGCSDGHNIRKGIGLLNNQDYIYAKFTLHPITNNHVNEPLGLALNYYITSAGIKVPYPSNTLGSSNILLCEPTTTYNPTYGAFNVIGSDHLGDKKNNLKTQISRKPFNSAVVFDSSIATGNNEAPSSDLNTTLLVEIIDISAFGDINASCSNPDAAVSEAIFVPIAFTNGSYTANIASQTDDYYNFATKNAAFRIWYFADQNGTLSQNWTANVSNSNKTLHTISGLYDSAIHQVCATPCNADETSVGCFTCIKNNYAQALCSRDNFSIRPESYDVHIYDVNNSLASNTPLKNSTKFDISSALGYSPTTSQTTTRMNLAAGYTYRIDINATGHDGVASVTGYTRIFSDNSDYNAKYFWKPQSLTLTCNDSNNSYLDFYIANGEMHNLENIFSQVGEYTLDILDKSWTAVDWRDISHHDTSSDGGFASTADCLLNSSSTTSSTHGCNITTNHGSDGNGRYYQDHNITFHPYKFLMTSIVPSVGLNHTPLTSSTTPQYVYMSNIINNSYQDQNMSFHLNGQITAAGFNDVALSNYTASCFANNLDLDLLKDTNVTLIGKNGLPINYRINFHNLDVNNSIITADTISQTITQNQIFSINASYFTDALFGSINTIANLNYDRNTSNPANPKIIAHKQYNIGCSTAADCTFYADLKTNAKSEGNFSIDANNTLNSDIVYYYGRTNAPRQRFVGPDGNVSIYYEVYCNGTGCHKTLLQDGIFSTYTNDPRWFRNRQHDSILYGNQGTLSQKGSNFVQPILVVNTLGKTTTLIKYQDTSFPPVIAPKGYPYKATIENNASSWLIYNPYNAEDNTNEFQVEFINSASSWAGVHETNTSTSSSSATKTNRRSMW